LPSANKELNNSVNSFSADEVLCNTSNCSNNHGHSSLRRDSDAVVDNNDLSSSVRSEKSNSSSTRRQKFKPLVLAPNDHVVLIVDDNIVNQKIIAKILSHFKIEYRLASDGKEAVDFFLKEQSRNIHTHRSDLPRFALVLMDLRMPIKDGYQAISELRTNGVTVPIVALTANALQQERDRAAAVGATDFQTKPILRNDLYAVCKGYLQTSDEVTPLRQQSSSLKAAL
jgi:CheY-like chemotaxis protein